MSMTIHFGLAAGVLGATINLAQPGYTTRPIDTRLLQRLDESYQDTGPLRTSLLLQPIDLRQPLGFEDVFRLPGSGKADRHARISGGLTAVFPRSAYVNTEKGRIAIVPAGTIYYIGSVPAEAPIARAVVEASEAMRSDTRASAPAAGERVAGRESRASKQSQVSDNKRDTTVNSPPGIMTDEAYRRERVSELLQQAAAVPQRSR